ncbi:ATPase AAA OS=Streptomyces fumanus OX=67302 GN=GCM10018772_69600 PE=3 SV=1 [Streptomyces fumanus]
MTSGFTGPGDYDPFAEFFARFFGGPRQGPRRMDIGRLLGQPARELVRGAAQYAAEHGSRDLDTEHLLRAALSKEPTRSLLSRAGADPDSLASQIDERTGPARHSPADAPAADARSRGPAVEARPAGRARAGPRLRQRVHRPGARAQRAGRQSGLGRRAHPERRPVRALGPGAGGPGGRAGPPGGPADLEHPGRGQARPRASPTSPTRAGSTRWSRRDDGIEPTVDGPLRRGKNDPVLIGDAGVGKTAIVEGRGPADRRRGRAGQADRAARGRPRPDRMWRRAPATGDFEESAEQHRRGRSAPTPTS